MPNSSERALMALLAVLIGSILMGCRPNGPKSLLEGEGLIKEGKYAQAVERLKIASELMPENPQVWNHLGLAYHGAGNAEQASTAYLRALALDRNLAPVYFNLGNLYLEENKLPESTSALSTFTVLQPNNPDGWIRLSSAQLRAHHPDDAEKSLRRAAALSPRDPEVQNDLGLVHLQRKRPREAMQAFAQALQFQSDYSPAILNQAVVAQYHLGNKPAALERYRQYLALRPDAAGEVNPIIAGLQEELHPKPTPAPTPSVAATNFVAQMLAARRTNSASTNLAQTIVPPPTNSAEASARLESKTNPVELASNSRIKPNLTISTNRTRSATKTNEPPLVAAVPSAEKETPPKPASPTVTNVAKIPVLEKTNTPPSVAVTNPSPVVTNAPIAETNPPTVVSPPKTAEPEPEPPVQIVAVDTDPSIKPAHDLTPPPGIKIESANTGTVKIDGPEEERPLLAPKQARKDSGIADRLNPGSWFRKKELEAKPQEKTDATPSNVQVALNSQPAQLRDEKPPAKQFPRFPYRKNLVFSSGRREEAQNLFSQAAREHQERRWAPALEHYKKAIQADPSFYEAHYNLALVAYQAGDLPLALAAGEESVAMKPGSIDARYNFALILRDANYFMDAADQLRELLVDSPDEVRAHYMLANLYAQQIGEPSLAARHYQRVLDLAPKHAEASRIRYWLANHR
jgi:tetratricopeptide (TPR) repeat protein